MVREKLHQQKRLLFGLVQWAEIDVSFAEVHIVIGSIATLPWESVNSQLAPVFAGLYEAVFDYSTVIL